jgi:hypothetical protein
MTNSNLPNVVAEWLAILFRIQEVQGTNLGPKAGYPEVFHGFLQFFHANAGTVS